LVYSLLFTPAIFVLSSCFIVINPEFSNASDSLPSPTIISSPLFVSLFSLPPSSLLLVVFVSKVPSIAFSPLSVI